MSAWSHLPNAKYIDLVLEHLKANTDKWGTARGVALGAARDAGRDAAWDAASGATSAAKDAARDAARGAVLDIARDAGRDAAWNAARDAAWNAAWGAACDAAWDAIKALIAYDDCAHLLESDPNEVEILARLGVPAAVLLLPACKSMNKELV